MALSDTNLNELKSNSNHITTKDVSNAVDTVENRHLQGPIHKYRLTNFLYKPPFGLPRNINPVFIRDISRSIYVYSIINRIIDEVVTSKWDIVPKKGVEMDETLEKKRYAMREFFNNPNSMDVSFESFSRQHLLDAIVLESGIIVKVFNQFGELVEMKNGDGATFTKNPDIYNTFNERDDLILEQFQPNFQEPTSEEAKTQVQNGILTQFRTVYNDRAAYFQYSNFSTASAPIPFGKKEIVWLQKNPQPGGVYTYGSPVQASVETVLTLIFGGKYNLDYFLNGNTPEGIIKVAGADETTLNSVKDQLKNKMEITDNEYGLSRRIGHNLPAVSAENVEFIPINFTSKDLEIITQSKWFMNLLWMMFGVSPDEMGFTETSNRATGQQQTTNALRKAYRPYMKMLEYAYTTQILTEFEDGELFEFKFDDTNLEVTKQELDIAEQEIRMGIKTPEMVAEEMGIDIERLKKSMTEQQDVNNEEETNEVTKDNDSNEEVKSNELKSIVKRGNKWLVMNKDKTKTLGSYNSKSEAEKRLREIEFFKNETKSYYVDGDTDTPRIKKASNKFIVTDIEEEQVLATFDSEKEALNFLANENIEKTEEEIVEDELKEKIKTMELSDVVKIVMKTMEMNSNKDLTEEKSDVELKGEGETSQKELVLESPIEKVMAKYIKSVEKKTKEITKQSKK